MWFRSKKSRSSKGSQQQASKLTFERLEERQMLTGNMYIGTNLDSVTNASTSDIVSGIDSNGFTQYQTVATATTPFNDLIKQVGDTGLGAAGSQIFISLLGGAGNYTLTASGTGTVRFGDATNSGTGNGFLGSSGAQTFSFNGTSQTRTLTVSNGNDGGTGLALVQIQTGSLSNIKLIKQGRTGTFDPGFTDDLSIFSNLRFMDWGRTNGSSQQTWNNRIEPSDPQGTTSGVALEYMVAIANQLNQDAWFTFPAEADNNYITQAATYIKNNLNSGLKAFVEYSNETWNSNGAFTQYEHVIQQGRALGWGDSSIPDSNFRNDIGAGHKYVARRSTEIWGIFENVLGSQQSSDQLVKVLGSHSNNPATTQARLDAFNSPIYNLNGILPDALAIAPYFSLGVIENQLVRNANGQITGLTSAFNNLSASGQRQKLLNENLASLDNVAGAVQTQKDFADANDLWLIAYEGGQHLGTGGGSENQPALVAAMVAANRDPQMYAMYTTYLNTLRDGGISLFSNFTNAFTPGKWGAWGALESQNQSHSQAHKHRAVKDWANNNPVSNLAPIARAGDDVSTTSGTNVQFDGSNSRDLDGTIQNTSYRWTENGNVLGTSAVLNRSFSAGPHTIQLRVTDNNGSTDTDTVTVTVDGDNSSGGGVDFTSDFSGTSAGGWSRGAGALNFNISDGLGFMGQHSSNQIRSTLQHALNNNIYVKHTVTPSGEVDLRGSTFDFTVQRDNGWNSPQRYQVRAYGAGLGANGIVVGTTASIGTATNQRSFSLTLGQSAALQTSSPVEFRIYAYEGLWYGATTLRAAALSGTSDDNGTGGGEDTSDFSGSSSGGWALGAGALNFNISDGLGFMGHHSSNQTRSTLQRALNNNIYVKHTLTPTGQIDLRGGTFDFTVQRDNGWNSPQRYQVRAYGTGFGSSGIVVGTTASIGTATNQQSFSLTLGQNAALQTSGPVEFRIYAYEGLWYGATTLRAYSLSYSGGDDGGGGTTPINVTSNFSGSSAGGWALGAGFASQTINNGLGFSGTYSATPSTKAYAISHNQYVTRTIQPNSGQSMDLRGAAFNFSMQRPMWHSPQRFFVMAFGDGLPSSGLEVFTSSLLAKGDNSVNNFSFNLSQNSAFQTSSAIEFRIYSYSGQYGGKTAILRSFSLNSV